MRLAPCHDDEPPARPELVEGAREERGQLPLLEVVHDLLQQQPVVGLVDALHEAQPVRQEPLDCWLWVVVVQVIYWRSVIRRKWESR